MFELLDEYTVLADGSPVTVTSSNQALVTLAIPERKGIKYYLCHFELYIATSATAVQQSLDFEILNEAVVVKTYNFTPTAIASEAFTIKYDITHPVAKNTSGTITLQLGNAASDDVETDIIVKNVWVAAVG